MSQELDTREKLADLRRDLTELAARIDSAFLRDEQGFPDYSGHRNNHKEQAVKAENTKRTKDSIVKNIYTWAIIGILTVIGSSLAQVYFGAAILIHK